MAFLRSFPSEERKAFYLLAGGLLTYVVYLWFTTGRPLHCDRECNAGYVWASNNEISDEGKCSGSKSFIKGCRAFARGRAEYESDASNNDHDGW